MSENSKIEWTEPCYMCVTQDICRERGECVQRDAWPLNEELDRACRWNAFVMHLHTKYRYLLNFDLAMQIAREAQDHFEEEIEFAERGQ